MGMLINGQWSERDDIVKDGAYQRTSSSLQADEVEAVANQIQEQPHDYWLIGSYSCPWSHRVLLMHGLKDLPLAVHYAHGRRSEGYSLNAGKELEIPGASKSAKNLHEVYSLHDSSYTGRVTVPVLWHKSTKRIVSNESENILEIFDAVSCDREFEFTLRPAELLPKIQSANFLIYNGLNNAVYRAGFAESQSAYDDAITAVFETLDFLEQRLKGSRFYFGNVLTETDLRLFPTLVRFDAVYAILFKCALRRLTDYPNLWAYTRDLFALKGVSKTVNLEQIRHASYLSDSRDRFPIIAVAPDINWSEPNKRYKLGPMELAMRSGRTSFVRPTDLAPLTNV